MTAYGTMPWRPVVAMGICSGGKDDEDRAPSLVLAEDDTCGEWEPCA